MNWLIEKIKIKPIANIGNASTNNQMNQNS